MKSLEESVVTAMDGSESELFPFLPYILQDLWEIGTSPEVVIDLVRRHANNYSNLDILDLGCGKGAVLIRLAKEFIDDANSKAKEFGVDHIKNHCLLTT